MAGFLQRHYLTIDTRTLACTRVALASTLLIDLAKRASSLSVWYTDDGLLPRFAVAPLTPIAPSFFWQFGSTAQAGAAFAGIAVVYLALLAGLLTKAAQVLSLVCVLSLQHRVQPLTSGGDIVMCLLCWWTLFLPLGSRFSVDGWLRRKRRGAGDGSDAVASRTVTSVAVLGALLQLAVIYLFNALHKDGPTWRGGSAVHFVMWLDRVNTPVAVWVREWLPLSLSRVLTWGTLALEGALPFLILSPFGKPWTRRIAVGLIVLLHGGISAFLNVGPFSLAMIAFSTLLLTSRDWDDLERRRGRRLRTAEPEPAASYLHGLRRPLVAARELGALALLYVVGHQVLLENRSVPDVLRPEAPAYLNVIAAAARLGENWGMFSPDVGTHEVALVIDATTVDGRRVDPYNALAVGAPEPSLRQVQTQIGYDVLFHHYAMRAPDFPALHPALDYWVFAHHRRTGSERDRIVAYRAYVLLRQSPLPGARVPLPPHVREFLSGAR